MKEQRDAEKYWAAAVLETRGGRLGTPTVNGQPVAPFTFLSQLAPG